MIRPNPPEHLTVAAVARHNRLEESASACREALRRRASNHEGCYTRRNQPWGIVSAPLDLNNLKDIDEDDDDNEVKQPLRRRIGMCDEGMPSLMCARRMGSGREIIPSLKPPCRDDDSSYKKRNYVGPPRLHPTKSESVDEQESTKTAAHPTGLTLMDIAMKSFDKDFFQSPNPCSTTSSSSLASSASSTSSSSSSASDTSQSIDSSLENWDTFRDFDEPPRTILLKRLKKVSAMGSTFSLAPQRKKASFHSPGFLELRQDSEVWAMSVVSYKSDDNLDQALAATGTLEEAADWYDNFDPVKKPKRSRKSRKYLASLASF